MASKMHDEEIAMDVRPMGEFVVLLFYIAGSVMIQKIDFI